MTAFSQRQRHCAQLVGLSGSRQTHPAEHGFSLKRKRSLVQSQYSPPQFEHSLGYGPYGKRVRKVVSGKTKQEVKNKLKELHDDLARSVRSSSDYTLNLAVDDWLSEGMDGRSAQTIAKY